MTDGEKPKLEKVTFEGLRDVPIEQIFVSPLNSRQTDREIGLPELEGSIDRIGLLQPIVVIQRGTNKFECIAGQRRFNALKALGQKHVPAIIVSDMTDLMKALVSFQENIQRYDIAYSDRVDAVSKLYDAYSGSPDAKVSQISADLGISREDVIDYLTAKLIPASIQKLVDDGRITPQKAHDITAAFWPEEKEMLTIATMMGGLTSKEFQRVLDLKRQKPKEKLEKLVDEAKKPALLVTYRVTVTRNEADMLEAEALRRSQKLKKKVTVKELIHDAIKRYFPP